MPGKVNPAMAECLDMVCFQIVGNDLTVALAVQAGQLELNVMTPVIMHNVLQSIQLLSNYLAAFREKCVEGIVADEVRCARNVNKNPSLAVFLSPYIGYLKASKLAQQALKEDRSVKEIVLKQKLLDPEDVERIFSRAYLLGKKRAERHER
jgi:aspartate ammonia-lyase